MAGSVEVTKEDILKMWLDWVEISASWVEEHGFIYCHFCSGTFTISKSIINHKDDCIYKLTDEYLASRQESE